MAVSVSNLSVATIVAAISWLIDRVSKLHVLETLQMQPGDVIDVIPGILKYTFSWNYGINFGLFASDGTGPKLFLSALALAVSIALMVWAARHPKAFVFSAALGLVVGGALGNAYDRMTYGAVADFLNVTCCGINNPFAFNVADITIFAGVFILLFLPTEEQRDD